MEVVASPAGDDDVGALLEGLANGLVPHLSDEGYSLVDVLLADLVTGFEVLYFAGANGFFHALFRNVGINPGEFELHALLMCNLAHNRNRPVDVRFRAGATGAANNDRDLGLPAGFDELGQLSLHADARDQRVARSQIVWSRIGRAGIDGNDVRPERHAALERFGAKAVAERAGRRQNCNRVRHRIFSLRWNVV